MYIIAIDPGFTGGICLISKSNEIHTIKTPLKNDDIDVEAIVNFIKGFKIINAVIEDIHSVFSASAKSNFQFGRSLGIIEGIIKSMLIPVEYVQPKIWQKEMFKDEPVLKHIKNGKEKTDTKAMALNVVKKLYPHVNLLPTKRSKKPSDGIVDAILIAEYYRRKIF